MKQDNTLFYHFVAFITVSIWGSTFVWTKLLLHNGLSPAHIFTLRFFLAYILLLIFSVANWKYKHRDINNFKWMADNWKDELLMVGLGISGGSLYFLTENAAMLYTTATNTSLIVCSCPLFATFIIGLFYKSERFQPIQILGSVIALTGMGIVVLNGHFVLHLSPLGDTLAFSACLCWAVYSLLMKPATERYSAMFITRKVFLYGILTMIPYYIIDPGFPPMEVLLRPQVISNLLFLGCVASMICFLTWNWCISKLGTVKATNWVYFNPVTTITFAWWILDENITIYFLIGSILILSGMFICNKRTSKE